MLSKSSAPAALKLLLLAVTAALLFGATPASAAAPANGIQGAPSSDQLLGLATQEIGLDVLLLPSPEQGFGKVSEELAASGVEVRLWQVVHTQAAPSDNPSPFQYLVVFSSVHGTVAALQDRVGGDTYNLYDADPGGELVNSGESLSIESANPLNELCSDGTNVIVGIATVAAAFCKLPLPVCAASSIGVGTAGTQLSDACNRYDPTNPMYVYFDGPDQGMCYAGGCAIDLITSYYSRPTQVGGRTTWFDVERSDARPIWDYYDVAQPTTPQFLGGRTYRVLDFVTSNTYYGTCQADVVQIRYSIYFANGRIVTFDDAAPVDPRSRC